MRVSWSCKKLVEVRLIRQNVGATVDDERNTGVSISDDLLCIVLGCKNRGLEQCARIEGEGQRPARQGFKKGITGFTHAQREYAQCLDRARRE